MLSSPHQLTRWVARATLAGVVGLLCWALAPALSAQPYLPAAKDFGQRLPAAEQVSEGMRGSAADARDEGPVTHVTPPFLAPARFDLAGLAGEMRHYELRARETAGAWGPWMEVGSGDPVWFGGVEQLQLRTRGWRPSGRIHYVNVSGDATPADAALTAARSTVSDLSVAAARLFGGESAVAGPDRPAIVSREEWGAERRRGGCEPRKRPDYGTVRAAVVHHTVSDNSYSRAEAPGMVLAICRYHRNANGWDDIGYNALVDRFGTLYEGRDGGLGRAVVGAHSQGFNAQTSGLASLGTHTSVALSRPAMRAAADFLAWKLVRHGKDASGRATLVSAGGSASRYGEGERVRVRKIIGHRKVGLTECPGTALHRKLDRLIRKVRRRIAAAGGKSPDGGGGGSGGIGG